MKKKYLIIVFFCTYFFLGLSIVGDYGVSWDEPTERFTSIEQYKFAVSKFFSLFNYQSPLIGELMHNRQMLHGYPDRYYGTFVHWPLVAIEHATGFTQDMREIFFARHLQTFAYFFIATICLYQVIKKRFNSWKIGLLSVLILITSPRFFAESFYNNKDILFASWYMISISLILWFFETRTIKRAIIAGIFLGIAINTRITAVSLYGVIGISAIVVLKPSSFVKSIISLMALLIVSLSTYIVTMPTAWGNELGFIPEVFKAFAHYNWQGKTMYLNGFAVWNNIPWHYIPVYAWATTPLWYSLSSIVGMGLLLNTIRKKLFRLDCLTTSQLLTDLFIVLSAIVPLISVIVLRSVVYNGWRHLYFIYFPLVYCMIYGINYSEKYKKPLTYISLLIIGVNAAWMIKNHPYQYLYFNPISRINASHYFERDYWGVVTLDNIEYILQNDNREKISIWENDYMFKYIDLMLNKDEKSRFLFVKNIQEADYMSHYFYNTQETSYNEPGFEEIRSIEVDGIRAQTLYQRSGFENNYDNE